jgi:hypothetical protein
MAVTPVLKAPVALMTTTVAAVFDTSQTRASNLDQGDLTPCAAPIYDFFQTQGMSVLVNAPVWRCSVGAGHGTDADLGARPSGGEDRLEGLLGI